MFIHITIINVHEIVHNVIKSKINVLYSNCKDSLIKWVNRKQKLKINDKSLPILDDNIVQLSHIAAFILQS